MLSEEIFECRICKNKNLLPILDLGLHAQQNTFPAKGEADIPKTPMVLVKCDDRKDKQVCGLLQLKHTVSPDQMYNVHYGYRSGVNRTMTIHLQNIVKDVENRIDLKANDIVVDIGSNDATLLKSYSEKNLVKIGIDPTGKKFREYYTAPLQLVPDYFTLENYRKASPHRKAKVITAIAMFYDLPDPVRFVSDAKWALADDGLFIIEQSYMPFMLECNSFDTAIHEHLEYYTFKQIEWIAKEVGLKILDVKFNDINGGSFRVVMAHESAPYLQDEETISFIKLQEERKGFNTLEIYDSFKNQVESIKKELGAFLKSEKLKGKSIYVYGASAKGNTLLQYLNLDTSVITAAAERNPEKFGRRTPGTNIPIVSEEEARKAKPDYFIVLPWHFKKEFLEREKDYLIAGGNFIFPLPTFEVISKDSIK